MFEYKNKLIYQIWPRSFKDSNQDGIGDISGIIEKLDYLVELGVDLIWLSPIYLSENKDYGYDIVDYYQINPEFGTMEDFDFLHQECLKRGMNIIMDLVANHTSDKHEWFLKALADPLSEYRDYYVFKPGINGKAPNNWLSCFGGSAWQLDPISKEYYLTLFTENQCDLNWENPKVRAGIYEVMRFWLDKGIAGFRLDVINTISKMEGYPSKNPHLKGYQFPDDYIINRIRSHDFIQEMNREVLSHYDCMTIGEGMLMSKEAAALYCGENRHELDMMLHFDLHMLGCGPLGKYDFRKLYRWKIRDFKKIVIDWQIDSANKHYWIANYLSNHDQTRQVSRFGDDQKYRYESATALALLNLTLIGTPILYQGEECGMSDSKFNEEDWRDYEAINDYQVLQEMMHLPAFIAKKIINKMTRDHARTPMQWNSELYGGFSSVQPWIKMNTNTKEINIETDLGKQDSIGKFYREIIKIRKENTTFSDGQFIPVSSEHPSVLAYTIQDSKQSFLIIINLSKYSCKFEGVMTEYNVLLSNYSQFTRKGRLMKLKPFEAHLYQRNL